MGCYSGVYVGPVIVLSGEFPLIEYKKEVHVCENCGRQYYASFNYCNDCGGKVVEKRITKEVKADWLDLLEEIRYAEMLYEVQVRESDCVYLVDNQSNAGVLLYHDCESIGNTESSIIGYGLSIAVEKMRDKFASVISFFESKGITCKVDYVVLEWYSC